MRPNPPLQDKSHSAQSPRRLRILHAEDDERLASMIRVALERLGHSVERAENGRIALELLTEAGEPFDVLITDNRMPLLTGLGLIAKLRDTSFSGHILVHCSQLTHAELEAFNEFAVDAVIPTPSSLGALCEVIDRLAK